MAMISYLLLWKLILKQSEAAKEINIEENSTEHTGNFVPAGYMLNT